jgi:hypothetical protein
MKKKNFPSKKMSGKWEIRRDFPRAQLLMPFFFLALSRVGREKYIHHKDQLMPGECGKSWEAAWLFLWPVW